MTKHTVAQVEDMIATEDDAEVSAMLREYATLLAEKAEAETSIRQQQIPPAYATLLAEKENNGTTHWAGCSESGAKHYKCALLEISRLRDTVTDLRNKLEKKTWFSAYEKKPWVGLTDEDREECLAKNEELGWWGVVNAIEQSLKEKNGG